jgi:hypothetical protein
VNSADRDHHAAGAVDVCHLSNLTGSKSPSLYFSTTGRSATHHFASPALSVRLLARVIGVGIETADMLVHEVLSRNMHDRRAIARYAGLTGSPDESGRKRREKGLYQSSD